MVITLIYAEWRKLYHYGNGHACARTFSRLGGVAISSRAYHMEYEQWPQDISDLTNNPRRIQFADDEYDLMDGWHNRLIYVPYNPQTKCGFVKSLGRDGKLGGRGYNKDMIYGFSENEQWAVDDKK